MTLTILGCGRFQITDRYNSTGNLVSTDTTKVLMDFGRGCLQSLTQLGVSVSQIDAICITHTHPDHIADLLAFFQIFFITCPQQNLLIIGPPGITHWFDTISGLVGEVRPANIQVREQPEQSIQVGDLTITTALMIHNVPDLAYQIGQLGKRLVYSGDTGLNENLVPFAQAADVLMLECSNSLNQITPYHLNPTQCGEIATAAKAKQLVLTHYGSEPVKTTIPFNGILTLAKDLLSISI